MRRLSIAAFAVAAGCGAVAPNPGDEPPGPALVIDVRNSSDEQVDVAFDYVTEIWSGNGATMVEPCMRRSIEAGKIGRGTFAVQIEGKTVLDAAVPAHAPEEASVFVSVLVGPEGSVTVLPPGIVEVPELDVMRVPGCG